MKLLRNAQVKIKLFLMASGALIFLVIVGGTGFYYMNISNHNISSMYGNNQSIEYIKEAKKCLLIIKRQYLFY